MKVIGRCELNEVDQKLFSLEKRYICSPSIKLLGKQGDHLEIKLKTKLSTLQEKINPFFEYIGLSFITLCGRVGFKSWCNSYSEAKKHWDKRIRVEILEINTDDTHAEKIITLWDKVHLKRKVDYWDYKTPSFFNLYADVPVNERNRLSGAVLKLVNAAPENSKAIFVVLESMSAKMRIAVAEAALPLVQAVKHKWDKGWFGHNVIKTLVNVPLEEVDSVAKAVLPLIQEEPNRSETFIDKIRLLPREERVDVVNWTLEVVRAGKLKDYDVVRCVEYICKVPVPYRAKFVELAVQLNQISPSMATLESIAGSFKNPAAVEMADATINALSKIPVKKSEFLKEALVLVGRVFFYRKEPDLPFFEEYFHKMINELVEKYSKDF